MATAELTSESILADLNKIIGDFTDRFVEVSPSWTVVRKAFQDAKTAGIADTVLVELFARMYTYSDTYLYQKLNELSFEKCMFIFDKIGIYYDRYYENATVEINFHNYSQIIFVMQYFKDRHNIHRDDGPAIVNYDIDWNIVEESYLQYCGHREDSIWYPNSVFHRPYMEGPVFQSKIVSSNYQYMEFYAEHDIVLRQPHLPSITLQLANGGGEIRVHTGSLGEVLCLHAVGLDFTFVEFENSYPIRAEQFWQFLEHYTSPTRIPSNRYGVVGIFKKIIWSDGVIYQRNGNDIYVAIFPDGHREYFKDIYTYYKLYERLGVNRSKDGRYLEPDYYSYHRFDNTVDYLVDCPREMGIPHRVEFRRDEQDGSEYLQPAIEYPDNPDLNEYWVDGKKVSWNWAPKRSTDKRIHKKHARSSKKHAA